MVCLYFQNQRDGDGRGGRERHNSHRAGMSDHQGRPPPLPPPMQRQESSPPQLGESY